MAITSPILRWLIVIQTVTLVLLLALYVALSIFGVPSKQAMIKSFEDCIADEDSIIQESYPATCITKSQTRFVQPVSTTPEE